MSPKGGNCFQQEVAVIHGEMGSDRGFGGKCEHYTFKQKQCVVLHSQRTWKFEELGFPRLSSSLLSPLLSFINRDGSRVKEASEICCSFCYQIDALCFLCSAFCVRYSYWQYSCLALYLSNIIIFNQLRDFGKDCCTIQHVAKLASWAKVAVMFCKYLIMVVENLQVCL